MEVAASTASLMNAIKNCVAEFTKIHMQHIKFQQQLHLMKVKHEYKMKELEKRKELYSDNIEKSPVTELISWESEGAIDYINYINNQKDKKENI